MSDKPEFLDLSSRPAPTPGPLTKPVVTQRPRRRGRRGLLITIAAVLVAAAAVVAAIIWSPWQTDALPWIDLISPIA